MYGSSILERQQAEIHLKSKVDAFFVNFCFGTLLNRAGIRKLRGISPVKLFKATSCWPSFGKISTAVSCSRTGVRQGCRLRPAPREQLQLAQVAAALGSQAQRGVLAADRGGKAESVDLRRYHLRAASLAEGHAKHPFLAPRCLPPPGGDLPQSAQKARSS